MSLQLPSAARRLPSAEFVFFLNVELRTSNVEPHLTKAMV